MSETTTITVAGETAYPVFVGRGLRFELAAHVKTWLVDAERLLLVHPPTLRTAAADLTVLLQDAGFAVSVFETPDAEEAKTVEVLAECWQRLGQAGFTRTDAVIGLGGGATTDLAGFVAATWLRGVRVLQVPTTVLGMVDAAVGGKTGINTPEGKNLVGAFHAPAAVLCDLDLLDTLPAAELVPGLAEVVKCGFIADPVILDLVESDPDGARDPHSPVLRELVERAITVKAEVVGADLRESYLREILNYGHTFAHAIEHVEHFQWRHGSAVSVGMVFAAQLAAAAGHIDADLVARHRHVLQLLGLPTTYPAGRFADLLTAMRRDKKTRGAKLRFVVLDGVGQPVRLEGPDEALLESVYHQVAEPGR